MKMSELLKKSIKLWIFNLLEHKKVWLCLILKWMTSSGFAINYIKSI